MAIKVRIRPICSRSWLTAGCVTSVGLCLLVPLLLGNAAQVNDEGCFDQKLNEGPANYLKEQQKYNYGVVYGSCWAGKHSRLLLLLPLSNHSSLDDILGAPREPPPRPKRGREAGVPTLFYYYKGCVVNAAALKVGKDFLQVDDIAQGGMWQINRLGDAADELASFPLSFLPPGKITNALKAKPTRECRSLTKLSPEVP
jgi:hypothetical protein